MLILARLPIHGEKCSKISFENNLAYKNKFLITDPKMFIEQAPGEDQISVKQRKPRSGTRWLKFRRMSLQHLPRSSVGKHLSVGHWSAEVSKSKSSGETSDVLNTGLESSV